MKELLELAIRLSIEAGKEVLSIYREDFAISKKSDNSPLTIADITSHRILMHGLTKTGIPVLSEEGKGTPYEVRKDWTHFWLVDPLDGTKEFINRNGEFTINIALIEGRRPVLGVIYAPAKDLLYYSLRAEGAWKRQGNETKRLVSNREAQTNLIRVVGSRSHHSREVDDFISRLKVYYNEIEFLQAGSSLKFCLVAEGSADIYPRFTPTMEWDTAAGQAIVEEAGGAVLALDGSPLSYNKMELKNSGFIGVRILEYKSHIF
jgi:3'(2'), 5'-bisphosphate nucleotidase